MMKLELKHLSAYLPFGAQFISYLDKPFDDRFTQVDESEWDLAVDMLIKSIK